MVIIVLFTYNYLSSLNEIFEFQYFYNRKYLNNQSQILEAEEPGSDIYLSNKRFKCSYLIN
jgi:hypothetical protein